MPGLQNIQVCADQFNKILDELAEHQPATPESFGAIRQRADEGNNTLIYPSPHPDLRCLGTRLLP